MDMEVIVSDPVEIDPDQLLRVTPLRTIKPSEYHDRFTVRIDAYWEHYGEEPVGLPLATSSLLETNGIEPYIRKLKVTEQECELRLGDISREDVGYLLIYNTEGSKLLCNPTSDEANDLKKRVAVINDFEIHPGGMPFFARPSKDLKLLVKSLHGPITLQVCIFPR